jgi:hypothetical protein
MRCAKDNPLENGIHENTHQQQVYYGCEAASQKLMAQVWTKNDRVQIRRPPLPGVVRPAADAKDDGNQWLQDEAKSAKTRKPSRNVLPEGLRKEVEVSPLVRLG